MGMENGEHTLNPLGSHTAVKALSNAASLMDKFLEFHTGLSQFDRKLLTYYSLSTRSLPHAQNFPLSKLHGPPGTGKSTAARIAILFAYRPLCFSARGCTLPVFRDKLAQSYGGTAIIEEGDSAWKGATWFEAMLSDRYSRTSATVGHKVPNGIGGFTTEEAGFFGATIIHRRIPFADPALESRCIGVHFRPVHGRTYDVMAEGWETQWSQDDEVKAIQNLELELHPVEQVESIAGRIWNTYMPVIAMARLMEDSLFEGELIQRMERVSMTLKEAQATAELDAIAVRALIEGISKDGTLKIGAGVSLKDIRDTIWKNTGVTASPSQLGAIFEDLGFEKRKAHGVTKVYPSAATLIKACAELGIEDEAIDQMAKELKGKQG
jgi:hypothetical protein